MTRSLQVIERASVCENAAALMDPHVVTQDDMLAKGTQRCPLFGACNAGTLLGPDKHNCVPRMAQDVARYVARGGTLDGEMRDLERAPVFSRLGFIDPYANHEQGSPGFTTKPKAEILPKIRRWAELILNGMSGFGPGARDERCICPVLRPTPGGCPVHGG